MRTLASLLVLAVGCGGSVAPAPSGTGDAGGDVNGDSPPPSDTSVVDAAPETGPVTLPPDPPNSRWFAVKKLYLGLTDRATGATAADAWKQYGFDLDGRTTTREDSKTSANSCKRREGSPTSVLADGELGRDNNFGQHFMSVIKSLKADAEESINDGISSGLATILLRLENVTGDDNPSVPGAIFIASTRGGLPKWDGTDTWPIEASSLTSGATPRITFPKGSMKGGVWTSSELGGPRTELPLPIMLSTTWVPVESAVVTFNVKTGAQGTMAGGAPVDSFVKALDPMFRSFGICPGNATYDQVATTMTQAADLKSGAPQLQDTSATCDAMSLGIGFDVAPIVRPDGISPTKKNPDECTP